MSEEMKSELPYKTLGSRLKRLRERLSESLAEVSGAVEIDVTVLERIEKGQARPSADILQLLISHFDMRAEEASTIWKLAGYEQPEHDAPAAVTDNDSQNVPSVIVMPMDVRIAYTDMAHVAANDYGVTINFMQSTGPNNQPLVVSRLGMSREHAASILALLQQTLKPQEPKALPKPKSTRKYPKKNSDN